MNTSKIKNIMRLLLIALWPITFLLLIGYTEMYVRMIVTRTFNSFYRIRTAIVCISSGIMFAFNSFSNKELLKQKSVVIAYIFSGISIVAFCAFRLLLLLSGVFINRFIWNTFSHIPSSVLSLVLGYTTFSTIKAIIIYRKLKSVC